MPSPQRPVQKSPLRLQLGRLARDLLPPLAIRLFRYYRDRYGCYGEYQSWEDATRAADGYDSDLIFSRVYQAFLALKNGFPGVERDGVLHDSLPVPFPVLAALLDVATRRQNRLRLIDFGGSLGSLYHQLIPHLGHLSEISWNVVEQPHFVEAGRNEFSTPHLHFYATIEECLQSEEIDLILLSSVVQYLPRPYEFLAAIARHRFPFLIFDRTAFMPRDHQQRLTVQRVPPEIYPASYPAWFLSRNAFFKALGEYEMKFEFAASWEDHVWAKVDARFLGFYFQHR